jgi:hypothetical protein
MSPFLARRQYNTPILYISVQRITWPNIEFGGEAALGERLGPWSILWFAW